MTKRQYQQHEQQNGPIERNYRATYTGNNATVDPIRKNIFYTSPKHTFQFFFHRSNYA